MVISRSTTPLSLAIVAALTMQVSYGHSCLVLSLDCYSQQHLACHKPTIPTVQIKQVIVACAQISNSTNVCRSGLWRCNRCTRTHEIIQTPVTALNDGQPRIKRAKLTNYSNSNSLIQSIGGGDMSVESKNEEIHSSSSSRCMRPFARLQDGIERRSGHEYGKELAKRSKSSSVGPPSPSARGEESKAPALIEEHPHSEAIPQTSVGSATSNRLKRKRLDIKLSPNAPVVKDELSRHSSETKVLHNPLCRKCGLSGQEEPMKPCAGCLDLFHAKCTNLGCCEGCEKIYRRLSGQVESQPLSDSPGAFALGKHTAVSPASSAHPNDDKSSSDGLDSTRVVSSLDRKPDSEQILKAETRPALPTTPPHYELITSVLSTGPVIGMTCPEITEAIINRYPHFSSIGLAEKLRRSVKATCSTRFKKNAPLPTAEGKLSTWSILGNPEHKPDKTKSRQDSAAALQDEADTRSVEKAQLGVTEPDDDDVNTDRDSWADIDSLEAASERAADEHEDNIGLDPALLSADEAGEDSLQSAALQAEVQSKDTSEIRLPLDAGRDG